MYRVIYKMMLIGPTILSYWTEEVIDNYEADPLSDTHNQLLQYSNYKEIFKTWFFFNSRKCPGWEPNCWLKRGWEILVCTAETCPEPRECLVTSEIPCFNSAHLLRRLTGCQAGCDEKSEDERCGAHGDLWTTINTALRPRHLYQPRNLPPKIGITVKGTR